MERVRAVLFLPWFRLRSREKRKTMHTGRAKYILVWRWRPAVWSQSPSAAMTAREAAQPKRDTPRSSRMPAAPRSRKSGA